LEDLIKLNFQNEIMGNFKKIDKFIRDPRQFPYLFLVIYFLAITWANLKYGIYFGLDTIFILFFFAAIIIGRLRTFLRDWIPFVLMFFGYEAMRGIADNLNQSVHIFEMIKADQLLFGQLPTVFLQKHLWHPDSLHWYDILSFFFYLSHFWFVFLSGFIIWLKKREYFKIFSWGFITLSALGFITYLLFPAMPPWDAGEQGYIEKADRLLMDIGRKLNLGEVITIVYRWIDPNEVAAMPSLHAAWAWFTSLFLVYTFGKKLLPVFILPFGLSFSLAYLGEHYGVDILAGIFYAFVVFWLFKKFLEKREDWSLLVLEKNFKKL